MARTMVSDGGLVPRGRINSAAVRRLLLLPLALVMAPAATADTSSCPPGEWRVWQRSEGGLDNDYVNDIAVVDGTTLFATGDLYPVATHGGGISVRADDGDWTVHRKRSGGLRSDTVYALNADGETLLAGTLKGAAEMPIAAPSTDAWRGLPSRPVMPFRLSDVADIHIGADRAWFATNAGLFARDGEGRWTRYGTDAEEGELEGRFVSAVTGDDDALWVGTSGHGVARFEPATKTWTSWTTADGLCNDYVYAIDLDDAGHPWVGTGIGVCRFDGSGWVHHTSRNSPLPDDDVRAVAVDDSGRVWLGTHRGAAVVDAGAWSVCSPTPPPDDAKTPAGATAEGLPHRLIISIRPGRDGTLWFGTYGGGVARWSPPR